MCLHGFSLLITSCCRQGIDHPEAIAVKRKFSLSQNGVARNGAEQAYYKNRALEALAIELTATYNTAHGTSFVFSDFVCRGFVCELACF